MLQAHRRISHFRAVRAPHRRVNHLLEDLRLVVVLVIKIVRISSGVRIFSAVRLSRDTILCWVTGVARAFRIIGVRVRRSARLLAGSFLIVI